MNVTLMRCVNLPRPISAGVMRGIARAGMTLAAFFSTRKYISNVASNILDCSFRFWPLSIRPAPSSMSRLSASSKSSSSLSLSALCPKLLSRSFSAFFLAFSARPLRISSRSSARFFRVCLRDSTSCFLVASNARMPSSNRMPRNGERAAGCAAHLFCFTSCATMWSASRVRSPWRSALIAPPIAAATVSAAAESVFPTCGTSADNTSVRKLKCGKPSRSPHRHRSAVDASGPPFPRCDRVFFPPLLRTMTRINAW
mmetsp:Transcript_36395/g.90755  ORF Transcript_36395/g.90755 Transcript_36395/m.90755 type:complete len:256 (+) Transcript_36395:1575-2342(+)